MGQAIRIHRNGGTEVMRWKTVGIGQTSPLRDAAAAHRDVAAAVHAGSLLLVP